MNFNKQYSHHKTVIDAHLRQFFSRKLKEITPLGKEVQFFIETLSDYTQGVGAKRIRGILTLIGYTAFKKPYPKALLDIAISFELVHSYLLIHDDIIDQDDFRRGKPTVHKRFEKKYHKHYGKRAVHLGESLAIILGDTADAYAIQLVVNSKFSAEQKSEIIALMYHNIQRTVFGEFFDVLGCKNEKEVTWMNQYKTSLYTFVNPLLIGATLAGATRKQKKILEDYGNDLGIAFQIQDDIIGLFGDEAVTGKPVGGDIKEKRKTLLILEAMKRLKGTQRQKFNQIWNKEKVTKSDIVVIKKLVAKSGALEYNQATAKKLVQSAKKNLVTLTKANSESIEFLLELADFVITRNK